MSRFGKTERTIFTIAIIMLLAFSYFLYDDSLLFPKAQVGKQELIGNVTTSTNDVRRKNLDTFSWLPATRQDQVFQNDSIYTGDRSHAQIQLSSGSKVNVQPNSLVTLNIKNGQMNLDLRYGNFAGQLAKGETLIIKSGNETFELQGTQDSKVEFKKSLNGVVDFKLLSGDARFVNRKKQTSQRLEVNSALAVAADGNLKRVEPLHLQLTGPEVMNVVRFNPDDPIPFSWSSSAGPAVMFEVEISPKADFTSISTAKISRDQKLEITEPLADGAYHWRVRALNSKGEVAAISKPLRMNLTQMQTPRITSPTPLAKYEAGVRGADVRWQASPLLKNFAWQIAKDPNFDEVVSENQTPQLGTTTPQLPAGNYWVRVQGKTADNKITPWSPSVPFNLQMVAKKVAPLERPILITKNIKFTPPGKDRNPASPQAPHIAWKPVSKSQNYRVEISKNPQFKSSEKIDVSATDTLWSKYRPGSYYYRVFAKDQSGSLSLPSDTGHMTIASGSLLLNPLKTIVNRDGKGSVVAPVSWSQVPYANSYSVQYDKSANFLSPKTLVYKNNSGSLELPEPGRYNVRVQAHDNKGVPVGEFSNVEQVLYAGQSLLLAPKPLEPFNNASVFLQKEMEPYLWLEWQRVKGATAYRIEISDKPDFTHILVSESVSGNRFLIKDRVPLGKIFWRVRAEDPNQEDFSEWAEKREFTLYHQKNETFIK